MSRDRSLRSVERRLDQIEGSIPPALRGQRQIAALAALLEGTEIAAQAVLSLGVVNGRMTYGFANVLGSEVYVPDEPADWVNPDPTTFTAGLDQLAARTTDLEARDAADWAYTPADPADWTDPDPNDAAEALDVLADRVKALEAGGGPVDASAVTYTPAVLTDWNGDADPGNCDDALDQLAERSDDTEFIIESLVPPPAPDVSDISRTSALGVTGKLSFGPTNGIAGYTNHPSIDINGTFTASGNNLGIYADAADISGKVNDAVTAHAYAYPADCFDVGDATAQGTLELWVNGSMIHSVNLQTFGTGDSLNGNGSGFTGITAATPVEFESGDPFTLRQYRTANWVVNDADLRLGYNLIAVEHSIAGEDRQTNAFVLLVDDATTGTTYSGGSFSGLTKSGLTKQISGVTYDRGTLTATFNHTVANAYRNTYSSNASAVTHPTSDNCSIASSAIPNMADEADNFVIAKTVTMDQSRVISGIIGQSSQYGFRCTTACLRTLQSSPTSSSVSAFAFCYDNVTAAPTDLFDGFDDEAYRIHGGSDFNADLSSNWDEAQSLVGASADYNDGAQTLNSALVYPAVNFGAIADGPGGNPNYSAAAGTRYHWRYFTNATAASNFRLWINGTYTLVAEATALTNGTNQIHAALRWPTQTGWLDLALAFATGEWGNTGDSARQSGSGLKGCYAATYDSGSYRGITIGSRNSGNSFNKCYLRITVPQGWTGTISDVTLQWAVT